MAEAFQHTHNFPRFNVLEYVKKLRSVNFTQEQAEMQALEMEQVVSRIFIDLKADIKQELHTDELATKKDLDIVKLELQKEIVQSSSKIILWVAGLLITSGLIQHFFK